jgi:hypothetical protein
VNTPLRQTQLQIDLVAVFTARAEARALLWFAGELFLHDAVDVLQADAERDGLVTAIGQDAVQAIMAAAFAVVRDDLPGVDDMESVSAAPLAAPFAADLLSDDQYYADLHPFTALRSAWADQRQRRKLRDARTERARTLLDDDVSLERAWHELNARAPGEVPISTLRAAEYLAFQQNDLQRLKDWLAPRSPEDRAAIRKHLSKRRGSSCR